MIAEDSTEYDARYSDQCLADNLIDKVSETVESSTIPLARKHIAQKHYYALDKQGHHSGTQINMECKQASLAVEAAVAIIINGIHYAVLMASPHQLEYLAVGFLFSEV